jgi:hypothetical protein
VPFTAQCPHCRQAKFKVPWKKQDERMTCPNCRNDFLLLPADAPQPKLANRPGGEPLGFSARGEAADRLERVSSGEVTVAAMPVRTAASDDDPATDVVEPALVVALASIVVVGVALVVAYMPYGRYVSIVLAPFGMFAALLSLVSLHKSKMLAVGGLAGNAVVMLVLLVWPSLIGLGSWVPPPDPNEGRDQILAVPRDGSPHRPATGVDALQAAWQQDDCRIDVTTVRVAPSDPKVKSSTKVLRIALTVTNVGVGRMLEIPPLPEPPNEIVLAGRSGVAVPRRSVDLTKAATVFPGKSLDVTLTFDVPAEGDLKLTLPSKWLGHRDPAVIAIPATMIAKR